MVSVRPRLCANKERILTDEQFVAFMRIVRKELPVEFPEFAHPSELDIGPAAKA